MGAGEGSGHRAGGVEGVWATGLRAGTEDQGAGTLAKTAKEPLTITSLRLSVIISGPRASCPPYLLFSPLVNCSAALNTRNQLFLAMDLKFLSSALSPVSHWGQGREESRSVLGTWQGGEAASGRQGGSMNLLFILGFGLSLRYVEVSFQVFPAKGI